MTIKFTKMHGCGNDFIMLDGISQHLQLKPSHIRRLADRHFGIGCDQVLIVEPPGNPDVDFRYRIFNPDGSEAEQCGNGARCFARFVRHRRLTGKRSMTIETNAGITGLRVLDKQQVEVDMGVPALAPASIPLKRTEQQPEYHLIAAGRDVTIGAVSMGNPHAILRVEELDGCTVHVLGPAIEQHPDFPARANVGFMKVGKRDGIELRVYERGAGETLACGSGACAAVVWGRLQGWLDAQVTVELPGGKLSVRWEGDGQPVFLTGPTAIVFEGSFRL